MNQEESREVRLEKAEGDLLARRRKCERMLQASGDPAVDMSVGDSMPYASLEVYRGDDYLQVRDVDGISAGLIRVESLPEEYPERIEKLQEELDEIHVDTLSKL